MRTTLNYTIFALLATMANLAAQEISHRIYNGPLPILAAVMAGTVIGLVVKYILDKKFIFRFHVSNAAHDARTFTLYTTTGVATTLIFWGFEFGFNYLYHEKSMRYIGAVIGLAIGYYIKYRLDKRFVFGPPEA